MDKIFLFLGFVGAFLCAEPQIHIRVGAAQQRFVINGDITAVSPSGTELLKTQKLELEAGKSGITLNSKATKNFTVQLQSPGLLEVDGRKFRRSLEAKQDGNQIMLVHSLALESYITGVISSEVPSSWPLEVLKAQAIAARTYAIWQKDQKTYLESSVMDQVYHGAHREHALAEKAVKETAGQILTYDSKPAHTYFHAACGGHTASSEEAFGGKEPYLKGVSCPYCHKSPGYRWEYKLSRKELDKKLGAKISDLEPLGETDSGRVKKIRFKSKPSLSDMNAGAFRKALGYTQLRSTLITKHSVGFLQAHFAGRGFGHGVGMCQWGALRMAKLGKTAEQILAFYYPATEIMIFY